MSEGQGMAGSGRPVVIDGKEISTREAALAYVSPGPGFGGLLLSGGQTDAREDVRGYAEKIWDLGRLLDSGGNTSTAAVTH